MGMLLIITLGYRIIQNYQNCPRQTRTYVTRSHGHSFKKKYRSLISKCHTDNGHTVFKSLEDIIKFLKCLSKTIIEGNLYFYVTYYEKFFFNISKYFLNKEIIMQRYFRVAVLINFYVIFASKIRKI